MDPVILEGRGGMEEEDTVIVEVRWGSDEVDPVIVEVRGGLPRERATEGTMKI